MPIFWFSFWDSILHNVNQSVLRKSTYSRKYWLLLVRLFSEENVLRNYSAFLEMKKNYIQKLYSNTVSISLLFSWKEPNISQTKIWQPCDYQKVLWYQMSLKPTSFFSRKFAKLFWHPSVSLSFLGIKSSFCKFQLIGHQKHFLKIVTYSSPLENGHHRNDFYTLPKLPKWKVKFTY